MISLSQILEDISKLVIKGCFIIKEVSQKMNQVYFKDQNYDPVTEADYLVQYTIESYLKNKYPGLKVIGEENLVTDEVFCKQMLKNAHSLTSNNINCEKILINYPYASKEKLVEKQKICLWIDPLDCTRGFVSNKKEEVTILVGISENNIPIAGVIGQPFKLNKFNKCTFDPRVFIGSDYFNHVGQKKHCFQFSVLNKKWRKWQQYSSEDQLIEKKVAISNRRLSERQKSLIQKMDLEKMPIGGAGYKVIMMIKKKVGSLMFVDSKTSKWDSCAGEAIIRALGGYSIKPNLQQICYCPLSEFENLEGFIISLSMKIFEQIKKNIEQYDFQNFQQIIQNTNKTLII